MVPASGGDLRPDSLRPLNLPRPVRVLAGPDGEPGWVEAGRRMERVASLRDRWRVDDRWWTEQPVTRLYYELELEGGEIVTLFQDSTSGFWYAQRVG